MGGRDQPWEERRTADSEPPRSLVKPRTYVSPTRDPRDLRIYGPRLKVTIGPPLLRGASASRSAGLEEPGRSTFLETDALLDTGASRTLITPEVARRARLAKIDEVTLKSVGGHLKTDVFAASLQFPRSGLRPSEMIALACCELQYPLYHCLLGRDVLSRWVFAYDGSRGTWNIKEEDGEPRLESEGADPDPQSR